MKRHVILGLWAIAVCPLAGQAQEPDEDAAAVVRERLTSYVETFNQGDAAPVVEYWTTDAVSVQEESGERTEGREALLTEFKRFFEDFPNAQLTGAVEHVQMVGDDVAIAEGDVTLITGPGEPTQAIFTAVLKKQGGKWLIASSHERDLPTPPTPYDALKELEWAVGTWQDQIDGATVTSTVRWSPSQAFLLRSYHAQYEDGEEASGTQVFGWDPLAKQIRTWTFHSDGTFGDGTVSNNGDEWIIKMNQIQSDGTLASGTTVITKIDDDTLQVQKLGESLDGEPVPASDPVTVVRIADEQAPATETPQTEGAS